MTTTAQVEYRNEIGQPADITLHIVTTDDSGPCPVVMSHRAVRGITSKAAAMAVARRAGAAIV